jgi:hypothetical protein
VGSLKSPLGLSSACRTKDPTRRGRRVWIYWIWNHGIT